MSTGISFRGVYPQQGDLRLSCPPSDQGASGGARTCYRIVLADLRASSLSSVPPSPPSPFPPSHLPHPLFMSPLSSCVHYKVISGTPRPTAGEPAKKSM
ncbi:hypothetical protein PoB_003703100 [Plakobranchus ocellatus]|uniref:Uncharacterized protein n=1 Tax=Plakobranchus ocellatus TaxID=259542 RepID=A0AAV4AH69_9GAST|nr:hypothetical protein PoB_003703100 [Plakobranchus ocellatus]